ncbi:hypothetical protein DQ04_08401020, partial [Trypanosoma grayi]|uniref:hypothetical protein n=1 Tax=Trypanosoma grayi TaxID=71804 RepID=UPI0004F40AB9
MAATPAILNCPAGKRCAKRRRRYLTLVILLFPLLLLVASFFVEEQVLEENNRGGHCRETADGRCALPIGAEPDLAPWLESVLQAQVLRSTSANGGDCSWIMAPEGETMRLAPACAVDGSGAGLDKPRCSSQDLAAGSLQVNGGATRAWCVTRGFQPKCHIQNMIVSNGNFFTFKGENSSIPAKLFPADATREGLARYHRYRGHPVREFVPLVERGSSILHYCRYVVKWPAVFLYRASGHSTYHLWLNNLGPFFATLHDDFRKKKVVKEKGVFDGELPLIIAVDDKPRTGPRSPLLLNELLHHFTGIPILNASEFSEPTCFP